MYTSVIVWLCNTPIKHDLVSSLEQEESISNFTVFSDEFSLKDISTESHSHSSHVDICKVNIMRHVCTFRGCHKVFYINPLIKCAYPKTTHN